MKTKNFFLCIFIITLFYMGFFEGEAFSDIIHLKNNNNIEGIIESETNNTITINVGIGKFTVNKDDVESVEKTSPEEKESILKDWRKKDIERGNYAPPGLYEVSEKFQELKDSKERVERQRVRLQDLKEEFDTSKMKFDKLVWTIDKKSKELKNMNPNENIYHYNNIVSEINSLNAELVLVSDMQKKLNDKNIEYNRALHKAITEYKNKLDNFKTYFESEDILLGKREINEDEAYFFETIKSELVQFENDFKKDIVTASKSIGKSLVVEAKLNGKISTLMVVDTGADIVTITVSIANQLGIDLTSSTGEAEVTLADGSKSKAKLIHLESVEVGDSKAENVLAAVMDNPPSSGVDGLLGMSFLNNFNVKIDSANNTLILETIQ